jgi:hypothetical protein
MMTMVSGLGLVLYMGCATSEPGSGGTTDPGPDHSATADTGVILQIEVENGHSVSFHEPAPGGLYVAERMMPGQSFVLRGDGAIDAIAAFSKLRPGVEVPAVLKVAYDRARNLPSVPGAAAEGYGSGGQPDTAQADAATPGVIQQALTSSSSAAFFADNNGGCNWGPSFSFCTLNWSGGRTASATSSSGLCIVDHYAGNGLTVQITVNGNIVASPFQNPGTIVQYSLGNSGPVVQRRVDITNASGDSFHIGCRWGV